MTKKAKPKAKPKKHPRLGSQLDTDHLASTGEIRAMPRTDREGTK